MSHVTLVSSRATTCSLLHTIISCPDLFVVFLCSCRQCYLNRILSVDPRKFERQLLYHVSNNKQRTVPAKKVVRVEDFYGQILTVKEKAQAAAGKS